MLSTEFVFQALKMEVPVDGKITSEMVARVLLSKLEPAKQGFDLLFVLHNSN